MPKHNKEPLTAVTQPLRGLGMGLAITGNTFFYGPPVLTLGLLKTLAPSDKLDKLAIKLANKWIAGNNWLIDNALPNIDWHITIPPDLSLDGRYLLTCNHQTWIDTTVMQYVGLERMPLTRFFTKWELIFIPFLGLAFKILGFPMMKRHSKEAIAKNPALKLQDLEEARRACNKLVSQPYTLLNFLEGTRFTATKHKLQQSPFKHLLKPKVGGIGLALQILGKNIDKLIDMTIVYPDGVPGYADFWQGKVRRIGVDLREIEIPDWILNNVDDEDPEFRAQFQQWVTQLWQDKDQLIETMLYQFANPDHVLTPASSTLSDQTS